MSAQLDPDYRVHYCLHCGPCLLYTQDDETSWALHKDIPHPLGYNSENEENEVMQ
jgi:hypothetical protein